MKFILLHASTAKEEWSQSATELYLKKLQHFVQFEIQSIKPKKLSRDDKDSKRQSESDAILQAINSDDFLILFDEKGAQFNSIDFSKKINQILNSGKKRAVFIVGGAYGVNDEIKKRAHLKISLSQLTFNHLLAITVALEQIYRGFTIIKNIPYHND